VQNLERTKVFIKKIIIREMKMTFPYARGFKKQRKLMEKKYKGTTIPT
jgi:hypothetical protein